MIDNTEKKFLTSFDKSYSSHIFFKKPDKYKEIEKQLVNSENVITTGSNYSYAPLGFDKNSLSIDLSSFNRILDFNLSKQQITVEAGITILELLRFTLKHNLWLPQIPGYPFISLGGIVATNSHGKSCDTHGTIRRSIKKIKLFHKIHGWLNLSNEENKEIFELTVGGLGLTGTIVSITLQLHKFEDISFYTQIEKVVSFKDCLEKISNRKDESNFVYSWNRADNYPNFGSGYIFRNKMIKRKKKKEIVFKNIRKKNFNFPIKLWNKFFLSIVNKCFYEFQNMKDNNFEEDFVKVIFPYIGNEKYFKFFGSKGFFESQIIISKDNSEIFIEEFLVLFKKIKPTITLFSIKNMSGSQSLLRFEKEGICMSFDFTNEKNNLFFLDQLDKLCIKYNGLPSIIKDSRLSKQTVISCYPHYLDFKNKLFKFDKKRIYRSKISNKLDL
jgi:hypothetical protein